MHNGNQGQCNPLKAKYLQTLLLISFGGETEEDGSKREQKEMKGEEGDGIYICYSSLKCARISAWKKFSVGIFFPHFFKTGYVCFSSWYFELHRLGMYKFLFKEKKLKTGIFLTSYSPSFSLSTLYVLNIHYFPKPLKTLCLFYCSTSHTV